MRIVQNTFGLDKNFLIKLSKIARVPTNNLKVKIQNTSSFFCNGICFRFYRGYPFIGLRIPKNATQEHIGKLWLHELSHHRDNLKRKRYCLRYGSVPQYKKFGGEKKADKFADKMWQRYLNS